MNLFVTILFFLVVMILSYFNNTLSAFEGGSLLLKNYIIRYDRGWDVLCEPYIVKKNDWVLKIFRQKGEISNKDFREFSNIFLRINRHISDINTIRPGQRIDIPLKKIRKGTFAGQSTGVVTIPYVSLTNSEHLLQKEKEIYIVQKGDTLSKLLIDRFGSIGSESYRRGFQHFREENPSIENFDMIYAGQKLSLTDPSIRNKKWFDTSIETQGRDEEFLSSTFLSSYSAIDNLSSVLSYLNEETKQGPIAEAANALDARFHDKGTYYFPIPGKEDFELDLSKYPIIDMGNGKKYIITSEDKIMGVGISELKSQISDIEIIKVDETGSPDKILESIFESSSNELAQKNLTVRDQGIEAFLRAKWIRTTISEPDDEKRFICIIPITSNSQRTPDSIKRFLDEHHVEIKEVLSTSSEEKRNLTRHKIQPHTEYPRTITPKTQKQFVKEVFTAMGYHFSPDVDISFPYSGIQVKTFSNLLSSKKGKSALVDFGELYGDAISSIKKTGMDVIRIATGDNPPQIIHKLLNGLSIPFSLNPTYFAAERPEEFNIIIKVSGFLVEKNIFEKTLLSQTRLHPEIVDFLNQLGIKVIIFG